MAIEVWGIPNCGTVKKARAWLDAHGVAHRFVNFRETPPDVATVRRWEAAFGEKAMRNTSGGSYRELGPEKDGWTPGQWVAAFARDPMLLKRPVVCRDGVPVCVGWNHGEVELRKMFPEVRGG